MSLIHLDSLSRYGATDGAGLTGINRTGNGINGTGNGYSGNCYHRTTGGMFGQPFIATGYTLSGEYGNIPDGAYIHFNQASSMGTKVGLHCKMASLFSTGAGGGNDGYDWSFPIAFRNVGSSAVVKLAVDHYNTVVSSESNSVISQFGIRLGATGGTTTGAISNTYSAATQVRGLTSGQPALTTYSILNWISVDLLWDTVAGLLYYSFATSAGTLTGSWAAYNAGAVTSINSIILGNYSSLQNARARNTTYLFSDVVIYSNDGVGLTGMLPTPNMYRVKRLVPDGVGTNNAWTPTAGTSATCVDDTPASDTDYTQSTSTSTKVDFTLPDLGSGSTDIKSNILGVQINSHLFDTGSTVATALPIQTISGTETSLGSAITPSRSNYTVKSIIRETNPQTSVEYTAANINNLAVGFNVG